MNNKLFKSKTCIKSPRLIFWRHLWLYESIMDGPVQEELQKKYILLNLINKCRNRVCTVDSEFTKFSFQLFHLKTSDSLLHCRFFSGILHENSGKRVHLRCLKLSENYQRILGDSLMIAKIKIHEILMLLFVNFSSEITWAIKRNLIDYFIQKIPVLMIEKWDQQHLRSCWPFAFKYQLFWKLKSF